MQTLTDIIQIIRINETPIISLSVLDGFNSSKNVGDFKDAPDDNKIEKAISWLTNFVSLFPKETVFSIVLKKTLQSNGSGVYGPYKFVQLEKNIVKENLGGLSGFNNLGSIMEPSALAGLGYIHKSELDKELLKKELEYQSALHKREIEDLRGQFNDAVEMVKISANRWSPENMQGLLSQVFAAYSVLTGKELPPALAGMQQTNAPTLSPMQERFLMELSELSNEQQIAILQLIKKIKTDDTGTNADTSNAGQ